MPRLDAGIDAGSGGEFTARLHANINQMIDDGLLPPDRAHNPRGDTLPPPRLFGAQSVYTALQGDQYRPKPKALPYHGRGKSRWAVNVKFAPGFPKQLAWKLYDIARDIEGLTREEGAQGCLKQSGLKVLQVLMFDFLNFNTGRCDPCYESIAEKANLSRTQVQRALQALEAVGLIEWDRRIVLERDKNGIRRVQQTSNAYRIGVPFKFAIFCPKVAAHLAARWKNLVEDFGKFTAELKSWWMAGRQEDAAAPVFRNADDEVAYKLMTIDNPELRTQLSRWWQAIKSKGESAARAAPA